MILKQKCFFMSNIYILPFFMDKYLIKLLHEKCFSLISILIKNRDRYFRSYLYYQVPFFYNLSNINLVTNSGFAFPLDNFITCPIKPFNTLGFLPSSEFL